MKRGFNDKRIIIRIPKLRPAARPGWYKDLRRLSGDRIVNSFLSDFSKKFCQFKKS